MQPWITLLESAAARTWQASWQAAILGLIIWAILRISGQRLTPAWRHGLLSLVVLRLLLPTFPQSDWSLFNLVARSATATGIHSSTLAREAPAPANPGIAGIAPSSSQTLGSSDATRTSPDRIQIALPAPHADPAPPQTHLSARTSTAFISRWTTWLAAIWFLGLATLLVRIIVQSRRFALQLRAHQNLAPDSIQRMVTACADTLGLQHPPLVLETPLLSSPAVYGFLNPRLLMPTGLCGGFSQDQLRHVILHELAHVKRRDLLTNWVITVLQAVHWFNPVLWLVFARLRTERELACDAMAMNCSPEGEEQHYGETVIKLVERLASGATMPSIVGILEDRAQVFERLRMISRFSKRARGWSSLAAVLTLALAIVGLTDSKREPAEAPSTPPGPSTPPTTPAPALLFHAVDAESGKPITGMTLKANGQVGEKAIPKAEVTTDADGKALLPVPTNRLDYFHIMASREGYPTISIRWESRLAEPIPESYTLKVAPGITVGGYVRAEDGTPLRDAKVAIEGPGIDASPDAREHLAMWGHTETTDAAGFWKCTRLPKDFAKRFTFTAAHPEFAKQSYLSQDSDQNLLGPRLSTADLLAQKAELVMHGGLEVSGTVVTVDGSPIQGAQVLLGERFTRQPRREATDAKGHFTFKNAPSHAELPDWRESITVQAPGYVPDMRMVRVTSDSTPVEFRLAKSRGLKGRVIDTDGKPIAGARVSVEFWRGMQTLDWEQSTTGDGAFSWDGMPEDSPRFFVGKQGYMVKNGLQLQPGGENQDIVLIASRHVRALVVDAVSKRAIASFKAVKGWSPNGTPMNWDNFSAQRFLDGKLDYVLSDPMANLLRVEADGYNAEVTPIPPIKPDGSPVRPAGEALEQKPTVIELKPIRAIAAQVLLPNGQPARGAAIALTAPGFAFGSKIILEGKRILPYDGPTGPRTVADDNGKFELPAEGLATKLVIAHKDGYAEFSTTEARDKSVLQLQPWGRIEGQLRIGTKPAPGQKVRLEAEEHTLTPGESAIGFSEKTSSTVTDSQGRFVFESVPPGQRMLCRVVPLATNSWTYAAHTPVNVLPGDGTTRVTVGGGGRQVIGRFKLPGDLKPEGVTGWASLTKPRPADRGVLGFLANALSAKPPEVRFQPGFPVVMAEPTAFRIDDVTPGVYELNVSIQERPDPSRTGHAFSDMSPLAHGRFTITIPEAIATGSDPDAAVDVGEFALQPIPATTASR